MTLARENQNSFEEYLNTSSGVNPGIDLTVSALNAGFWPSYKSHDVNIPAEMVNLPARTFFACDYKWHIPLEGYLHYLFFLGKMCGGFQGVL